jgi:hypothetical protein
MKRIAVIITIFLAVPLTAQNAKVIQLSPEDAKQAKVLHDEQEAIAKKIVEFDQAVRTKYLTAPKEQEGHTYTYNLNGSWVWVKDGWGTGTFQYSEDFKFIVPVPGVTVQPCGEEFCGVGSPVSPTINWIPSVSDASPAPAKQ